MTGNGNHACKDSWQRNLTVSSNGGPFRSTCHQPCTSQLRHFSIALKR